MFCNEQVRTKQCRVPHFVSPVSRHSLRYTQGSHPTREQSSPPVPNASPTKNIILAGVRSGGFARSPVLVTRKPPLGGGLLLTSSGGKCFCRRSPRSQSKKSPQGLFALLLGSGGRIRTYDQSVTPVPLVSQRGGLYHYPSAVRGGVGGASLICIRYSLSFGRYML